MTLLELLVKELPARGGWPQNESNRYAFRSKGHDYYFGSVPTIVHPGDEMVLRTDYEAAIKQSEWNGEGLPPVGTECEWYENKVWTHVKIVYLSEWVIVLRGMEEGLGKDVEIAKDLVTDKLQEFRPIRTESQRDQIVKSIYQQSGIRPRDGGQQVANDIYDAITAHKIPGVTTVPTVGEIMRATVSCSREDAQKIVDLLNGA